MRTGHMTAFLLALAASGSACPEPAVAGPRHVGTWTAITSETDPGKSVTSLWLVRQPYTLTFYCQDGPWRVMVSKTSDDPANPSTNVGLTYSVDGGAAVEMTGTGHKGYMYENARAGDLVADLMRGKGRFALAIEPEDTMSVFRIRSTSEAFAPYLSRCPLP